MKQNGQFLKLRHLKSIKTIENNKNSKCIDQNPCFETK